MKKIISLLLVATLVVSCGLLVGCGSKKDDAKKAATEVASKSKEVATKAQEVATKVEEAAAKAQEKKQNASKSAEEQAKELYKNAPKKGEKIHGKGIVGKWEYDQKEYKIPAVYTFKKGGKGEYNLAGQIKKLTWKTKGNTMTIRFEETDADMNQKYKLKGDKLQLYDITDKPVTYYRIK